MSTFRTTARLAVLAVLAAAVAAPLPTAQASMTPAGSKVTAVTVFAPNAAGNVWARVDLDVARSGQPGCASATNRSFVFKVNSDAGKAWVSELITARAAGLSVWINGTGGCGPSAEGSVNAYEEITAVAFGQ